MLALNLLEIKDFMHKLLCTDTFDNFLLREASIRGACTWELDGTINTELYSANERTEQGLEGLSYLPFRHVRTQCFDLIKGKRAPLGFKFVFLLSPANLTRTLEQLHSSFTSHDINGLFINIKFQQGKLLLTTGISYRIFSADKSLEQEWDALVRRFLKNHEISFEEL